MNKKIIAAVAVVIIAGGAFYAGTVYSKSGTPARGQFAAGTFNGQTRGGAGGVRTGGGLTAGEIISKDSSGVTVKMQDGSTKIVILAASTAITKSVTGSADDLAVGTTVAITGTTNGDGSVTAQMVQIRPLGFGPSATSTRQAQ